MPISIKNDQTELLARKLAKITGETLTEVIRSALAEKYDRVQRTRTGTTVSDELNAIALSCARRPEISALTADEILGYDDFGAPTR